MENKKLYLAYGSNLNINQMVKRCPESAIYCSGELKNYSLKFAGSISNAYATIKKSEGESVPCGIWEITENDEKSLDTYEGYPNFYTKETVNICVDDKEITVMTYIMSPNFKVGLPSEGYEQTIREGYEDFGLDIKKFEKSLKENLREVSKKMLQEDRIMQEKIQYEEAKNNISFKNIKF